MLDQVGETVMQSAAVATGNGVSFDAGGHGYNTLAMQVTGITTATITFEATIDGTNWVSILATNVTSGGAAATATADGIYRADISSLHQVRTRVSAYTSGTITVKGRGQA